MQLRPLRDLVLAQRHEKEIQTSGGILLPGSAPEESLWITILAVGPDVKRVKVGNVAMSRQWTGIKLEPSLGFMSPTILPESLIEAVQNNE